MKCPSLLRSAALQIICIALLSSHSAVAATPVYGFQVVAKYPHSTQSFTEGLFFLDGTFYEGTGEKGHSQLLAYDPQSGRITQHRELSPEYFGEGIVDFGPNIYEWTWQTHTGFVYDRFSFRLLRQFTYTGEGWGMTHNAKQIITSDGTPILRFRDPATFKEVRHIEVKDNGKPVQQLNELEWVKGEIYANVWHSERIARISPQDGRVLSWIDLTGILPDSQRVNEESVLNGIAYDAKGDRLFVTGKQWPTIFEIKLTSKK